MSADEKHDGDDQQPAEAEQQEGEVVNQRVESPSPSLPTTTKLRHSIEAILAPINRKNSHPNRRLKCDSISPATSPTHLVDHEHPPVLYSLPLTSSSTSGYTGLGGGHIYNTSAGAPVAHDSIALYDRLIRRHGASPFWMSQSVYPRSVELGRPDGETLLDEDVVNDEDCISSDNRGRSW